MTILIIGLIVFFAVHFVPGMPGLKQNLIDRFGDNGYRGLFSVAALAGLGLVIWGFSSAEFIEVFEPPAWGRHVTMVCVLLAMICLASSSFKGRIRKAISHPMLFGIGFWSLGHLFANGDLAALLLFGSFLVFAVIDVFLANAQNRIASFEPKAMHDLFAIIGGVVIYAVFFMLHPYVIGVAII
jgi:uncharacterized membrane protein